MCLKIVDALEVVLRKMTRVFVTTMIIIWGVGGAGRAQTSSSMTSITSATTCSATIVALMVAVLYSVCLGFEIECESGKRGGKGAPS